MTTHNHDFIPDKKTSKLAQDLNNLLSSKDGNIKLLAHNQSLELNDAMIQMLKTLLGELASGNPFSIVPLLNELSTQEAADYLNVSRPYFVKLLEEGLIPFHKVGNHRRVNAIDVVQYKRKQYQKSQHALDELVKEAQKLNMGYKIEK